MHSLLLDFHIQTASRATRLASRQWVRFERLQEPLTSPVDPWPGVGKGGFASDETFPRQPDPNQITL